MSKWQPYNATILDILGKLENIEQARRHFDNGIDPQNEWSYYYDCFMWEVRLDEEKASKYLGRAELGDWFGLSNGGAFLKIKGAFDNYANHTVNIRPNSEFKKHWEILGERCTSEHKEPLEAQDGAKIKGLMELSWREGIALIFDYIGETIEDKYEANPFDGRESLVEGARATAEHFEQEFFSIKHLRNQSTVIGGKPFGTFVVWLVLKLIGAERAEKRSLNVFTYEKRSYLNIKADENEAFIGSM